MDVMEQFNLSGKVAVVTGRSKGLGRAIVIGLALAGYKVRGQVPDPDREKHKNDLLKHEVMTMKNARRTNLYRLPQYSARRTKPCLQK